MNFINVGHVKIALLIRGMRMNNSVRDGLGEKWQEKIYSYSLTDWTDKKLVLPSDIKLDNKVYVGFRLNPNSDWELARDEKGLIVRNIEGEEISAELIPRPKYYDLITSEGDKMQAIGVSCGNHGVSFFLNSYCEYFKYSENCKFCGLVPTQKMFSDTVKCKTIQQIKETVETILDLKCKIDFIQLSGGCFYDHDKEVRAYIPFIYEISKELEKRGQKGKIPVHLTSMPPKNLDILLELKNAGLDTISFNLECTTHFFFKKYCPGKEISYGYNKIREALLKAKNVFGKENVYSIVILGIEPRKPFVNGIEDIIKDGIIPTINIFHYDPFCSSDIGIKNPDIEESIRTAQDIANLFRKYNTIPGKLGCAHYDIGHEIRKGYF